MSNITGWSQSTLNKVTSKIVDGSHNPPAKQSTGRPMLSARNIENGNIVFDDFRWIADDDFEREHARTRIEAGDVLLTIVGSIGRTAVVTEGLGNFTLQRSVAVITPNGLLPKFLMYQFQSPFFQQYLESNAKGTAQKGVYLKVLGQAPVLTAPIEDQEEVVAEIEKQFSRLDEAVIALKRIQANLKRYKAAVLKAAVEGKLTEQWRKEHPDVEPADQLLKRILAERRAKWEAEELAKMKAKGNKPKDDSWKKKYKEPAGPDTANLPELPEGWVWATAEQLTDETRAITYGVIKLGDHIDGGVPILRSSDVRKLKIDYEGIKTISPDIAGQYRRTFLSGGEVVMTVRGTLGGVAVIPSTCQGFNVSREVAMLALVEPKMAHSVAVFIASNLGESWLLRRTKGIAYTGINIETLKALPIPVAQLQEQKQMNAEIDRRLSVTEELEATIETSLKRAERLRQTILQRAFSGGVVKQGVI